MAQNIINTGNYLLIVDESEIKKGDFPKHTLVQVNGFYKMIETHYIPIVEDGYKGKKITWHLPLNGSPELEGVPTLPPMEDEVEKLADEYANSTSDIDVPYTNGLFYGFIEGYNKAKEKYKFTEDDMKKAKDYGNGVGEHKNSSWGKFIQSLQQPKMPTEFEFEMEKVFGVKTPDFSDEIKTITLPNGNIQAVGRYL